MSRAPMYQVIEADLLAQIESGELPPRTRLPSEHMLARRYGVSRMTVRQALDRLEAASLLVRQRGSGNFVASPEVRGRTLNRLSSFTDELGDDHHEVRTGIIDLSTLPAPHSIAAKLEVEPGDEIWRYRRVRHVDERPAALQESWLPYSVAPGLARDGIIGGSLYRTLRERYGVDLRWAEQEMYAVQLDTDQAALLGVPPATAALLVQRRTYAQTEQVVEYAESCTLPDFPLSLRIEA